jgi:hypothetical protein
MTDTKVTVRFQILSDCEVDGIKISTGNYEGEKHLISSAPHPKYFMWVDDAP